MTMGRVVRIWSMLVILGFPALAQDQSYVVSLRGTLTTSSRLFPFATSTNSFERSDFYTVENSFGVGVELRYIFPNTNLALGLSAEYIRGTMNRTISQGFVPVEDGYR